MSARHIDTDRLDPTVQRWLIDAQDEADRLGARHVVSGLVLLVAASGESHFSQQLRHIIGVDDRSMVRDAFEFEWKARAVRHLDEPPTLMREAIELATRNGSEGASPPAFLSVLLSFDDGMAARISRRLGIHPSRAANELRDLQT